MNKLGFSEKEVGRMTFNKWRLLFGAYKRSWDIEMRLTAARVTYQESEKPIGIDDVIPF